MKTASFAQTRCFTVISRKKGSKVYHGRTWDVEFLKKEKKWKLIVNSKNEIENFLNEYKILTKSYLNEFSDFEANTIIIWKGLYKYENYLEKENRQKALKKQITEVTSDYLSLVFHRFLERTKNGLQIRINNNLIEPFNPFPIQKDFRSIPYKQKKFSTDNIKIEGFVLPSRSIDENLNGITIWTTKNKGLMDMEGIYIYRSDRIILFGGWLGLIKKSTRMQLARLRVDVGNSVDHLLHLNVAKSQVVIPHDLINAFEIYIDELKIEAEREFYNRGIKRFSSKTNKNNSQLFERRPSNKGVLLEINSNFNLLKDLNNSLNNHQKSKLNVIIKMINTTINKIRHTDQDEIFVGIENKDGISINDLKVSIDGLLKSGLSKEEIKKDILPNLGFEINTFPNEVLNLLK